MSRLDKEMMGITRKGYFDGLHNIPKKERAEYGAGSDLPKKESGPTIPKKKQLNMRLAVTFQKRNFLLRKFLMADISDHGPKITKKGNFDGWYKYLKNHFGIKFPCLVILIAYISNDETHNYQKRKFLMGGITVSKPFQNKISFFGNLMDYISNNGTHNCQKRKF